MPHSKSSTTILFGFRDSPRYACMGTASEDPIGTSPGLFHLRSLRLPLHFKGQSRRPSLRMLLLVLLLQMNAVLRIAMRACSAAVISFLSSLSHFF